jgi:hypothetical protein
MKRNYYIFILLMLTTICACQKDTMADITDGKWNKERNILNISFENQVGTATITRSGNTATIVFKCNTTNLSDLSSIKLNLLEISYGATASVKAGDCLNFENSNKQATITVTPVNGEPLQWVITLTPFVETLVGTWDIKGLYVYGGTGPAYGGAGVVKMSDKSWCWSATDGPAKEEDNNLVFTLDGFTAAGNTYGTVVNNAGTDGIYANFVYIAKTPNVDVNTFYRTIPKGTGTWARDYSAGTVTFTFSDGTTKVSTFYPDVCTIDLGDSKSRTLTMPSFMFSLSGVDDWTNIYTDYDKFVKNPHKYWVDVKKR